MPRHYANNEKFCTHLGLRPVHGRRSDRQTINKFLLTMQLLCNKVNNTPNGHLRLKPVIILYNFIKFNVDFIFGAFKQGVTATAFNTTVTNIRDNSRRLYWMINSITCINPFLHDHALLTLSWIHREFTARVAQVQPPVPPVQPPVPPVQPPVLPQLLQQ